jgi:hypothetical protein
MPPLSCLVAGNGEHTGKRSSWRCLAVFFTIAGPGSLQTGAAAAGQPAPRRRRGPDAGGVGLPDVVAAGCTTRARTATRSRQGIPCIIFFNKIYNTNKRSVNIR